jgi:purine-binding chemotaxis protein CheW
MSDQQVLEFRLNDEQYCTDIEHISEIVRRSSDSIRSLPDAPPHVEGIMNLRGETTKIVDPRKRLSLDVSATVDGGNILVLSEVGDDGESVGWMVTDVTRVLSIDTEDAEQADQDTIKGIFNRDDGFLLWTEPELLATVAHTAP